ncbi:exosome-associated family protein [Ascosphaera apis ARSEF 7405]|uniref:Exosome complex protein n=1 Tax=Ascosphaera apis ARSEF 7405 TaxID=392613 RepID=A0A166NKK3_9EURO|nr:exosome-associated family protein [Ascosphaera apis ARSEF 7405]
MESVDLTPLIEELEDEVDNVEDILEPLMKKALELTTQNMPVLDKAKLHVTVTYAIWSLLFCYLKLHGTNVKEHPIFRELTRVRQYFEKLEQAEKKPTEEQPTTKLDKEAANRFIKHGLAGNEKYDFERKEREAKEKAMAAVKAAMLARKRTGASDEKSNSPSNKKRR